MTVMRFYSLLRQITQYLVRFDIASRAPELNLGAIVNLPSRPPTRQGRAGAVGSSGGVVVANSWRCSLALRDSTIFRSGVWTATSARLRGAQSLTSRWPAVSSCEAFVGDCRRNDILTRISSSTAVLMRILARPISGEPPREYSVATNTVALYSHKQGVWISRCTDKAWALEAQELVLET